jgi:hypothetical protein
MTHVGFRRCAVNGTGKGWFVKGRSANPGGRPKNPAMLMATYAPDLTAADHASPVSERSCQRRALQEALGRDAVDYRVEDGAISERCFKGGWSSLMFIELEKAPLPKWLPSTHIRFAFADYGIDQLVGAIKLRVQEQGGTIKPPDALARAKAVKGEADYLADRNRLMRDRVWIGGLHDSIRETLAEIGLLAKKLKEEHGLDVTFGARDRMGILRAGFVSMGIGWKQPIANYVGDYDDQNECHLRVAEFSGLLVLPGENMWYPEEPKLQREWKFKVDVARDRSLVWRLAGKNEEIPASQLADRIVQIFLDLVSRAKGRSRAASLVRTDPLSPGRLRGPTPAAPR